MVGLKLVTRVGVGAATVAMLMGGMTAHAADWAGGVAHVDRVQYQDPRYQDPRGPDPRYQDPRYGDRRPEYRQEERGGGPRGSYQRSCRDIQQDGPTLIAVCSDGRGRERQTSIDLNRCRGSDIGNNRGVLQCGNVRGQ